MTKRARRLWWLGGTVLVLAVIAVGLWQFSGPLLKGIVASRASAAIGRTVTIGDLHIHPGRITTVVADDVVIAEPPNWPQPSPPLADIKRLTVRFDAWNYIRHRQVIIPAI